MKKIFSIIVMLLVSMNIFANLDGHFFYDVADENVKVSNIISSVIQWFDLPSKDVSFKQFRNETDQLGMQHLSYKFYYKGTEVSNAALLVHAKNGKVLTINGDLLGDAAFPQKLTKKISPLKAAQKVRKQANESDAELKIIRTYREGEPVFRYAYEVIAEDGKAKYYVDAEREEIIKTVPLVYNIKATAETYYSGKKSIDVTNVNDAYYLIDSERNIITYCANGISEEDLYNEPSQHFIDSIEQVLEKESQSWSEEKQYDLNYLQWWYRNQVQTNWLLPIYMKNCIVDYSTTTSFEGTYISSIKIDNIYNNNWSSVFDSKPDLYVVIRDNNGYVRYDGKNQYIDDATLPATITFGTPLWGTGYSIEIWDYDPLGSNNLIETLTLNTYFAGTYNWDDKIAKGSLTVKQGGGNPMYDVHWAIEKAYDFYKSKFNRNSYDNYGSPIYNFVNAQTEFFGDDNNNAFAKNIPVLFAIMVYGMGDGEFMNPVTELDIVGHEFSHLVTAFNGNGGLEYLRESGALNESFSDIMGASITHYTNGSYDWLMAKNAMIPTSNLRSMKDPHNSLDGYSPQPKYYNEQGYWINPNDTANDNGGVHTNSGVQNYWFYLLSEGGNGVTQIGIDKAVQIAYRNLIYYLTPEATFEDAHNGSIQAAKDLYGVNSQEHQSVVNAWYAVGVGDKYVPEPEKPKQITCAQAVQIAKGLTHNTPTSETYTVIGYVTDTDGKVSRNQQIFWMADTKNGGKVFESYWGNVPEVVHVGDKVSVTGNLMLYNTTSEIKNGDVVILEHAPQALDQITNDQSPMTNKVIRDGQILILRGERVYTVTGQEVK